MIAVFRHEISSYFTNLTGYVFGAFLLLFAGIYTMVYNLQYAVTNFEYVLSGMAFVFLIIVPILTMKVLAEERRQKTDQLLYSLPLTMTKVVMGKYLALLCMFLLPLAIISIYPLVLSMFGNVNLTTAFGSIFGFFCLGSALIAIGVFVSSITESQAVAAGVCFVIMLLNYFLSSLAGFVSTSASASLYALIALTLVFALIIRIMTKSNAISGIVAVLIVAGLVIYYKVDSTKFEGLFSDFVGKLSLFERFYTFVDGIFDITAVVYYISIAGLFLFLSVQAMEKRRWSE